MPRPVVLDRQASFGGGLNTTADEAQLGPDEVRRATNAVLTEFGAIKKRLGTQRVSAAAVSGANAIRGGFSWRVSGAPQEVVAVNSGLHYGTFSIGMSWTSPAGAIDTSVYPSFAAFRDGSADVLYVADGGALNKFNGTAVTTNIAGTPNVTQIAMHNLRLFGAGDSAAPQTLYWSALANGDTLGTGSGGSAIIRTFGQQDIMALLPLGDSLLIFHRTGISVFTGYSQDDIRVDSGTRGLSADIGTIAPKTVVAVENTGFFLTDRGIYSVSLATGVTPISSKIDGVLRDLNQSNFNRALAVHNRARSEVLFFLPDAGIYAYQYRLQAWSGPWTGIFTSQTPHSLWQTFDSSSNPVVLAGFGDGHVRRVDAAAKYTDDILSDGTGGTAFTLDVRCRRLFFGDPTSEKSLRYLYALCNTRGSATAALGWTTETGSGSGTLSNTGGVWGTGSWGTGTWGGATKTQRVQANGRGTYVVPTFSDDGSADSVWSYVEAQAFDLGRRF